ncbi:MAG: hypothetical protein AAB214_00730 [Fibrobacterota bacterium]
MKTSKYALALSALALLSCDKEFASAPVAPSQNTPAARVAVPMDLTTLTPWTLGAEQVITYSTDATGAKLETVKEGFRQWSAIFSNARNYSESNRTFVRFVYTSNQDNAQILVQTTAASNSAGCRSDVSPRTCNIQLKSTDVAKIRHWIGRTMGIPTTTVSGIMNPASSPNAFVTSNDYSIASSVANYRIQNSVTTHPLFEATYKTISGTEIIVGWANLQARVAAGYISGYKTIAAVMSSGTNSTWGLPVTYNLFKYLTGGTSGLFYPVWPFMDKSIDYSAYAYNGNAGIKGTDPVASLGSGCYSNSAAAQATDGTLFAFNPALLFLSQGAYGGNYGAGAPRFGASFSVPVYFYALNGSVRASTTNPGTSVCSRLGGYAFAVE